MTDPVLRGLVAAALQRHIKESGGIDVEKIWGIADNLGATPTEIWGEIALDATLAAALRAGGKAAPLVLNKKPPTVDEAAGALVGGARSP